MTQLSFLEPLPPDDVDRRYTLRPTLEWCKRVAGVEAFDLDVAADEEAHVCERYFTVEQDGLKQPWSGRVWVNPPYSDIEPWVVKAWDEAFRCDVIAMLLPANRTEQPFWARHVEPFRDTHKPFKTHFLPGRQSFGAPGNRDGIGVGSPPFGCVLLVWRTR